MSVNGLTYSAILLAVLRHGILIYIYQGVSLYV